MANKNINTRIIHKHDTETNWNKATNFIPMKGEIIVYDIDDTYNYERFKIGDGTTNVNNLSFYGDDKLDINQGVENLGKLLGIGDDGNVTLTDRIIPLEGTDDIPIILADLDYGIYSLNGKYKFIDSEENLGTYRKAMIFVQEPVVNTKNIFVFTGNMLMGFTINFNNNTVTQRAFMNADLLSTYNMGVLNTTSKTVIGAINEINENANIQSDWNQNDSTAIDYVKNRTHYIKNLYPEAVISVENPTIDTIYLLEDFTNSKVNLSGLQTYLTSDRVSKKDGEVVYYDGLSLKLGFLYSTMNFEIWPSADDISLIDNLNYKIACVGGNITFYVILDTSALTSEYSSKFSQVGIYGVAANEYVKSMNAYVVQCYMLDDRYIPSDLVTDRNLVNLNTTDKTVVGAINELGEYMTSALVAITNDEIDEICGASILSAEDVLL